MIEIRHEDIHSVDDEIAAYDGIYSGPGIRHLDSFYLWLLSLLDAAPGQRLLDVSSGESSLVYFARQQGIDATGLDFSFSALQTGATDYGLNTLVMGNSEQLPFAEKAFDFVTNIGSIEHYFHPETAIQEMSRVLRPRGVACILLPNGFSAFGNVKYVWQTGDVFDDGQPLQRYNTREGWSRLLTENGLQPMRIYGYEREQPRTWSDLKWYTARPGKLVRMLLSPWVPASMANSIVYLCLPT